ncbi:MAG: hypothetical protein ACLU3I_06985 [Acutalibacteraceae bacterium]
MVVQMDECLKAIQDAPLQHIRARKALWSEWKKAEMEEIKYRKLKASLYEDFKEDIIPKEDFLEIRAQYDSKITDALIAKEQVQRELNLELDKSGLTEPMGPRPDCPSKYSIAYKSCCC